MVRKTRYRQVLRNRHPQKGRYLKEVYQQQSFWLEDKAPTPDIEKVRELHIILNTWDKLTDWISEGEVYHPKKGWITKKGQFNRIIINIEDRSLIGNYIFPKANYKGLKRVREKFKAYMEKKAKEARLKEQERRTLEFFEREGC
ncbi:hypothetical protein [Bacillus cereus]|uniref:hypothetical protein n=1 Tax=Bacillus cereus TaxID=1396 RepID=UPI000BFAEDAA|nr:hypothetical protein [Bacillus cereus]PFD41454.1 hypothetical protein CN281_27110 [Bacillus cereus]